MEVFKSLADKATSPMGSAVVDAGGNILKGVAAFGAGNANAAALRGQARMARDQGYRDEEAQRREASLLAGSQAAAAAQAGGGTGGTVAGVIEQSAVMAELDALNIRYGASNRARGLLAEASAAKRQGIGGLVKGSFLAGGDLLKGYGAKKVAT